MFRVFFGAAAKFQVVAEPGTALLVGHLVGTYQELLLKLVVRVSPLHDTKIDIGILSGQHQRSQGEIDRILAEMSRYNESAQNNPAVFQALERAFKFFQGEANKYGDQRNEAWAKFNKLNIEFVQQLVSELRDLGPQQIAVLVEIRRDLGLTTDLEGYKQQMENE